MKFYRYEEQLYSYGDDEYGFRSRLDIELREYNVVKKTPKGIWLDLKWGRKRFVLDESKKKFACPTIKEAKISFLARKRRQLRILNYQLDNCKQAVQIAEKLLCQE